MTGLNGYDVALKVRRRRKETPIVFTTAVNAAPVMVEHLGRPSHVGKPYTLAELLRGLARAGA